MNARKLIALATTVLAFSATSVLAQTEMHVASWLPPTHPQNAVVLPTWGKWIEEATDGRVRLKIDYDLGHPKDIFTLVEDGVADAGWSFHGYVPGRFRLTQIVEQPLLGAGAEAASVAYWRIYEKYLAKANEHAGLDVVGLFTHAPGQIQTAAPVNSLAELEGKKIRLGGGIQSILGERLHVTAVNAPASKAYEMLQQGVIDGAFLPVCEQKILRLSEVATHLVLLPGGLYLGSFGIFINPDFMADLSEADQAAIRSVSGEKLSRMAGQAWDQCDIDALAESRAAGVNVVEVAADAAMMAEFRTLAADLDDVWFKEVSDLDVDARAALQELRDLARNYQH
jgi:TRAP-type C4-dicarboxylate transport system substrate-binding protein